MKQNIDKARRKQKTYDEDYHGTEKKPTICLVSARVIFGAKIMSRYFSITGKFIMHVENP